jgi:pilus assembly protein CpaC
MPALRRLAPWALVVTSLAAFGAVAVEAAPAVEGLARHIASSVVPTLVAAETLGDQVVVLNAQQAVDIPYAFGDVSVGSSELVKVVPIRESRQILIAGREVGTTNVIVYNTRGVRMDEFEVTVIPANLAKVMKNVQGLLDDIEGLSFKIVNDHVYIQGEVSLDDELKRVEDLDEREPLIESMVTLSPIAQKLLASLIQKEIETPGVDVRLIGKKIMLEGIVHSEMASKRAEAIARAYYPDVVNVLEVREVDRIPGRAETVVMIVHFVELTKSLVTSWGVEWTPLAVNGGVNLFFQKDFYGDDTSGYAAATVTSLLPRLDRARRSGYARVLENPTVSVKSGDTAHIFSGAKVPFVFIENGTQTVIFEDVGIKLDVTPYAQGSEVDLNIQLEVSSLGEVGTNGYPAIDTSQITTSQFARAGESIVIGGLQRVSDRVDYNRLPENSAQADGIFTLYNAKDYKKSKQQFLVFVTPQIHESSSTANREIQEKFNLLEVRQ